VTDYYVRVDDVVRELGETDLCWAAERVPGTQFASDVAAAVGAGGRREIAVDERDRSEVATAFGYVADQRPQAIYAPTLLELQARLEGRL
jgi:hypothetical protein